MNILLARTLGAALLLTSAQAAPIRGADGATIDVKDPKRVVVLEYALADDLTALGLKPVGWAHEKDIPDYLSKLSDVPSVGMRAQPSLEQIAALKPDFIVADSTRHKGLYPQLSRIAPTLVLNVFRSDYPQQLDALRTLGKAVGKEARANELIDAQGRLVKKAILTANRKAGGLLVTAPNASESLLAALAGECSEQLN